MSEELADYLSLRIHILAWIPVFLAKRQSAAAGPHLSETIDIDLPRLCRMY